MVKGQYASDNTAGILANCLMDLTVVAQLLSAFSYCDVVITFFLASATLTCLLFGTFWVIGAIVDATVQYVANV